MRRPRLAVTVGDPAGIGPEVVLKALARTPGPDVELTVVGPVSVLDEQALRYRPAPRDGASASRSWTFRWMAR